MSDYRTDAVYKLGPDGDPLGGLGLMLRDAHPTINAGKMSCRVRISRETPDRSRDIVRAKGAVLDNHQKNPVVCVAHNRNVICGLAEDRLGAYTVKAAPDGLGWDAETFFSQNTDVGEQTFRLVESKVFRGASIGFLPVAGKVTKSHFGGADYQQWELIEYSHLPIPDNPDCLVLAVEKGFGGKPLVPELMDILRPLVPERPVVVQGGWVSEVHKAGTYKTAEPKEAVAQSRTSTYYTCPHCGKEMTHEGIYKDEDGCTRHGDCRGHVVLKPEMTVSEAVNTPVGLTGLGPVKSYQPSPRFLPGLRRKAMPGYDDADDEFAPPGDEYGADDEFAPPDEEDEGGGMKAGAEFNHGLHDLLVQTLQFIEDGKSHLDNATVLKCAEKVSKWVEKALSALHDGHGSYLGEHPDQPELPGAPPGEGGEMDDEEDDDLEDDEDGDEPDSELEEDVPDDESAEGEGKPKKKKKPAFGKGEKAFSDVVILKALNSYWETLKRQAVTGDGPVVREAVETLLSVAKDKTVTKSARVAANEVRKSLEGLLVPKESAAVPPVTEWTEKEWQEALAQFNGTT